MEQAAARRVLVALFPERCLSAYSCEDLFQQGALIEACQMALGEIVERSRAWPIVGVVGVPLRLDQHLYNCAVVLSGGHILGVVPKTYLLNYREFYEMRQFSPADTAVHETRSAPSSSRATRAAPSRLRRRKR
jgi:NAD+ synthase (glutamine-hydrolysing)